MLKDLTGLDPQTIPLEDQATMSLFTGTQALGVTPEDINSTVGRLNDLMTGVSDARTGLLFSRFPEPVMTVRVTVMMNGGEF